MTSLMRTESGEEHGLINTLGNSVQGDGFSRFAEKDREAMKKLKKEEEKIVKARYINHRGMHERLDKPYMRWAGEPIRMYHLIPGETYELPMGMVNEINASGLMKRSDVLDSKGVPTLKDGKKERIHEMVPIAF